MENKNNYLMDLGRYGRFIDKLIVNNDGWIFDNDSIEHAEVLFEKLVDLSTNEISLYSSKLCDQFFQRNKVLQAFERAAERNVSLNIVVQADEYDCTNEFAKKTISTLEKSFDDRFDIKYGKSVYDEKGNKIKNFLLIDNNAIRIEKIGSIEDCSKIGPVHAKASVNAPESVTKYKNYFNNAK